jgi:hypothetical protein
MTDSTSDKHSTSFWSTRSIEEFRLFYRIGFLCQHGAGGRVAGEEGGPGIDPEIGSADVDVGAIGAGLTYTGWTISPLPLALMT